MGVISAKTGPFFLFLDRGAAQQKTLKIGQWAHFVPQYDKWFDETFANEWGQKHNTEVKVDHINLNELETRAWAEVSAKKGHDLFMFLSPPAAFEQQTIDMTHVYQECEKRHGKKIDLAHKSTYNPRTKRYFAFSDSYVPNPGNWYKEWWAEVGYPNGPDTWDDLYKGAAKIRQRVGILAAWDCRRNWIASWRCVPSCGHSVELNRTSTPTSPSTPSKPWTH